VKPRGLNPGSLGRLAGYAIRIARRNSGFEVTPLRRSSETVQPRHRNTPHPEAAAPDTPCRATLFDSNRIAGAPRSAPAPRFRSILQGLRPPDTAPPPRASLPMVRPFSSAPCDGFVSIASRGSIARTRRRRADRHVSAHQQVIASFAPLQQFRFSPPCRVFSGGRLSAHQRCVRARTASPPGLLVALPTEADAGLSHHPMLQPDAADKLCLLLRRGARGCARALPNPQPSGHLHRLLVSAPPSPHIACFGASPRRFVLFRAASETRAPSIWRPSLPPTTTTLTRSCYS